MTQYGLFNDESNDWTEGESVEAGFYSIAEALAAIEDRYNPEDMLTVHEIEEPEEEEEDEDDEDTEEEDEEE